MPTNHQVTPAQQLSLWQSWEDTAPPQVIQPAQRPANLTATSPLARAMEEYLLSLQRTRHTENTIRSFRGDLYLFMAQMGTNLPLSKVTSTQLQDTLARWQMACSFKTLNRRVTTLKGLFGWLWETKILAHNPAGPIVYADVSSPLPQVLTDAEAARLWEMARAWAMRDDAPDARPWLLLTLGLHAGLKREEILTLQVEDVEMPQEEGMLHLQVRFRGAQLQREKKKHHERIVGLPAEAKEVLTRYLYLYGDACAVGSDTRPPGSLWPWQARWLTHCLSSLAKEGRIKKGLGLEMLRWTFALRLWRSKTPPAEIQAKLGLSAMRFYVREMLQRLAG